MKLQSRSREEPEINVISLVDVLLVLVLFFMVSTSFMRETEISLQLPEATIESRAETPGDNARDHGHAERALISSTAASSSTASGGRCALRSSGSPARSATCRSFIRADAAATHQAVVTAMDVAGQLGFVKINIATVTPPEAKAR